MSIADQWNTLKSWAAKELNSIEGGVEKFLETEIPVLEHDVERALKTFGESVMGLVVAKLTSGLSAHETVSEAANSIIQQAEKIGLAILNATAREAGAQLVAAARAQLGAMATPK